MRSTGDNGQDRRYPEYTTGGEKKVIVWRVIVWRMRAVFVVVVALLVALAGAGLDVGLGLEQDGWSWN